MGTWVEEIGNQLWNVAEAFGAEVRGEGVLSLLRPIAPFNRPTFLAPAVTVSGTAVREQLKAGQRPDPRIMRPEIADILIDAYRG